MHHGTILFDSELDVVGQVLNVPEDKISSKGFQSVRSRVTNVKPYLNESISTAGFFARLRGFMFEEYNLQPYTLSEDDIRAVQDLKAARYDQWDWNFGASPACQIQKTRRVEGCGQIEVHMDVENGAIQRLAFYGDYFGNGDSAELARVLTGTKLNEEALRAALNGIDVGSWFSHLDLETFCSILLQ